MNESLKVDCEHKCIRQPDGSHHLLCPESPAPPDLSITNEEFSEEMRSGLDALAKAAINGIGDPLDLNALGGKPVMPEKIGVSSITTACESLKHYHWAKVLGRREETPAMKEGTQLHMLILEPEKFYQSYFTDLKIPDGVRMLKTVDEMKALAKEFEIEVKGKKEEISKQIESWIFFKGHDSAIMIYDHWLDKETKNKEFITQSKWNALHEMKWSVLNHAFTKKYLETAKKEFKVEGEICGQAIRGQLDWLVDDASLPYVICIDIKKVRSAKFFKFRNVLYDLWYFVQAALYTKMVEQTFNRPCLYVWIVVEGVWPYCCEAYSGNEAMIEAGMKHAESVVKKLKTAFETNIWPSYSSGMVTNIDIPSFGYDKAAALDDEEDEAF